jgi:hypothetical protein
MSLSVLVVYVVDDVTGLRAKLARLCSGFEELDVVTTCVPYEHSGRLWTRAYRMIRANIKAIRCIAQQKYDVVFVRYAYYFFPLYIMARMLGKKIQLEINSDITSELKERGQGLRMRIDRVCMMTAVSCSSLIHVVSNEVIHRLREKYPKAEYVFSPNFVVDESLPRCERYGNNDKTKIVFLGNASQPWQGINDFIERVVKRSDWFREHCELHLVGYTSDELKDVVQKTLAPGVVHVHGFLSGLEKDRVMDAMDIGVGVLSLKAKGMSETTAIKTCEYLYRGIPIIIGYTDLSLPAAAPFVLNVDLYDDPNVVNKLRLFVNKVREQEEIGYAAHVFARENLLVRNYCLRVLRGAHDAKKLAP